MPVTMPETYFVLVKAFPLTKIRDVSHYAEAQDVLDQLLRRDLDEGEESYLDILSNLLEAYETETCPLEDVPARDVLQFMMDQHELSQSQLAKAVGIPQSTISAIINGTREMTPNHMRRFGKHFHLPASAFLEENLGGQE